MCLDKCRMLGDYQREGVKDKVAGRKGGQEEGKRREEETERREEES